MNRTSRSAAVVVIAVALGLLGLSPASGNQGGEGSSPRIVGHGWVAIGDVENRDPAQPRATLTTDVPCPGEEVGFNPQPDPPGRLQVDWAESSFELEAVTAASCSNNLHEGSGTGRCGDQQGFIVNWRFSDGAWRGLGGPDTAELEIRGGDGSCNLTVAGPLRGGAIHLVGNPHAPGVTRWVDDDRRSASSPGTSCDDAGYTTIQAAVDAASPGDLVYVCPGAYVENVAVVTTDLAIVSVAGPSVTTVAAAASLPVFTIASSGVMIRGFTVRPAGVADGDIGINLAVDGDADAHLLHNRIFRGRIGINLGCASSHTSVFHNVLAGQPEAGVNVDTCEAPPFPGSHNNTIHHNQACGATSTASIALGGSSNDNHVHHNIVTSISVYGSANHVHHNSTQLAVTDNGSGTNLHDNTTGPNACP